MPGIVEVPVSTKRYGNFQRGLSDTGPAKSDATVFDEPLTLILPRAAILIVLWLFWSFAWSAVT